MRVGSILGSLALAIMLQNGAVRADDCGPLKQLNTVDLVAGPNRALVPVSINGIPKLFLLDTGGDVSQINGEVADELKLVQHDANMKMLDMYGHASTKMVRIEKFTIGREWRIYQYGDPAQSELWRRHSLCRNLRTGPNGKL
jgi:hypothetical protein